eukprot:11309260-Alexandrium_andersonii.AAC.1
MSASLVGSEMCIRDRSCGGPRLALRPRAHDMRGGRPTSSKWCLASGRRCLLYTSDAADDM